MKMRSFLAAALVFLASVPAMATPQLHNGTDMWFDPAESGWGLNIFHQGDTIFACLFVFGPDGQPRWYVASSLVGDSDGPYSGALYEATGPWFGGGFDPNAVTRRQVGTMTIALGDTTGAVSYTVDGVSVAKQIQPFTFRYTNLGGFYSGYQYQPAGPDGTPEVRRALNMTISDDGAALTISAGSNTESSCFFRGSRGQAGQVETASGTYTCGGGSRNGSWAMAVDPTPDGFTGSFMGNGNTNPWGRIAASNRQTAKPNGNGWRNDIWFPPNESGWGLNVVEQGDTLFATIFVYDPQQRSHWYVASALAQSGSGIDAPYAGALYEVTGPYFGTSFNPAAVTRRQVGTMTFQARDRSTGSLSYTVDGVAVTKVVQRFAFRKNDASGSYIGHMTAMNADSPAGLSYTPILITIGDGDGGFSMSTRAAPDSSEPDAPCTYQAPPAMQAGGQRSVAGTYNCGSTGTFTMENIFVTFDGFTAAFKGRGVDGFISGARLATN